MAHEQLNVYTYWTGPEYILIKKLRELMKLHIKNFVLLTPENIEEYMVLPKNFYNILPAQQADVIRVNVLCDRGGIWLDADTLVMSDLSVLLKILDENLGFMGYCKDGKSEGFSNGSFGTRANTKLMTEWKKEINDVVNNRKPRFWGELGSATMNRLHKKGLFDDYLVIDVRKSIYPIKWNDCVREFVDKPYDNYKNLIRDFQPYVTIVNSVYKKYETLSREKKIPLDYFLETSLNNVKNKPNIKMENKIILFKK